MLLADGFGFENGEIAEAWGDVLVFVDGFDEDAADVKQLPPTEASPNPDVTKNSARTAEQATNLNLDDAEPSRARDPMVYTLVALSVVGLATLLGSATYLLVVKR